jgi:hypothetical protein
VWRVPLSGESIQMYPPSKRQDPQGLPALLCYSRAAVGDGPYACILVLHIGPGVLGSQHLQHRAAQRPNVRLAACGTRGHMEGRAAMKRCHYCGFVCRRW